MARLWALTLATLVAAAFIASAPAEAQTCTVPDQGATHNAILAEVLTFGDVRVRISEVDPDRQWITIDVRIPGRPPTLGLLLRNGQSTKITACGPEVTITFQGHVYYTVQNATLRPVTGTITFSAF